VEIAWTTRVGWGVRCRVTTRGAVWYILTYARGDALQGSVAHDLPRHVSSPPRVQHSRLRSCLWGCRGCSSFHAHLRLSDEEKTSTFALDSLMYDGPTHLMIHPLSLAPTATSEENWSGCVTNHEVPRLEIVNEQPSWHSQMVPSRPAPQLYSVLQ
jgi:hypothetical protein